MIALVVAYSRNRVIGNNGKIPWKIKGEQRRFKELTIGNVVVMGRRTFEEIGFPLPDRYTIVVSNKKNYEADNCVTVSSIHEAIKVAGERDIYISGGAKLYEEGISLADRLYVI